MSTPPVTATDVLVIGAGPAGALAAHELARRGLRVLLVDKAKLPRSKVCGSILHPQGIGVLEDCGLGGVLALGLERGWAAPVRRAWIRAADRRTAIDVSGSLAVDRGAFDEALARAAVDRGAELWDGTTAVVEEDDQPADCRRVCLRGERGEVVAIARTVIAAGGLGGWPVATQRESSPLRSRRIGASWTTAVAPGAYGDGELTLACGRHGYVGLVRLASGRLLAACAIEPEAARQAGGVGPLASAIVAEARLPEIPGMRAAAWRGTSGFPAAAAVVAAHRLFAIGDAASFVEPFTGQGMSWALLSARAAAPVVAAAASAWRDGLIGEWTEAHALAVRSSQRGCRGVAWLLRRPRLTRWTVGALSRCPWLARPLVRRLTR